VYLIDEEYSRQWRHWFRFRITLRIVHFMFWELIILGLGLHWERRGTPWLLSHI